MIAAERVRPLLVGSRRLSVLEEFRVPFEDGVPAEAEWAQLSAGAPGARCTGGPARQAPRPRS